MYKTFNFTTVEKGQSSATVVAHTVHPTTAQRITTWELVYPRYIHSELLTHRVFSRNASSSRATPVKTMINEVRTCPAYFDEVRLNQKGMTGGEIVSPEVEDKFKDLWMKGAATAVELAEQMAELGIAKQTVNRILEPFTYIRVLVTATDLDNFFKLRLAKDAQPEIRNLAQAMLDSLKLAPTPHDTLHAPYLDNFRGEKSIVNGLIRSIAACARVSVARGDGKQTTFEEDLELVRRLLASKHMSPFEHVAFGRVRGRYANFRDWASLRFHLENDKELPYWPELGELLNGKTSGDKDE